MPHQKFIRSLSFILSLYIRERDSTGLAWWLIESTTFREENKKKKNRYFRTRAFSASLTFFPGFMIFPFLYLRWRPEWKGSCFVGAFSFLSFFFFSSSRVMAYRFATLFLGCFVASSLRVLRLRILIESIKCYQMINVVKFLFFLLFFIFRKLYVVSAWVVQLLHDT